MVPMGPLHTDAADLCADLPDLLRDNEWQEMKGDLGFNIVPFLRHHGHRLCRNAAIRWSKETIFSGACLTGASANR